MSNLDPSVWINISLTVVIAVAVIAQAWFTRKQARILEQSEQRAMDRDKPTVRIVMSPLLADHIEPSGKLSSARFEGFMVTNSGFVDIEITSFAFEAGRLPNTGQEDFPTAVMEFTPVERFKDFTVSTMSLPHRLRRGESFTVRYDNAKLVEESERIGGESPVHLRPYCRDSLGNKHMPHHWFVYKEGNPTMSVGGPSLGRISEEEFNGLSRAGRRRYSRWARHIIGR